MFGRCIFFLALRTIAALNIDVPHQNNRQIKDIIFHKDPSANFFQANSNNEFNPGKGLDTQPAERDVLPLFSSDMDLKIPKFLTNQNMWENQQKIAPKIRDQNVEGLPPKQTDKTETPLPNNLEISPDKKRPDDDLVKQKIFSLAKDTAKDLDSKISIIEKTNGMFKQNNYYKLGFIVSYINTTHNALTDLMRYVDKNKENWDVMKLLNSYVQIKKTKEFITEMVSILNFLQSRSMLMQQPLKGDKKKDSNGIAWSYYDDQ